MASSRMLFSHNFSSTVVDAVPSALRRSCHFAKPRVSQRVDEDDEIRSQQGASRAGERWASFEVDN